MPDVDTIEQEPQVDDNQTGGGQPQDPPSKKLYDQLSKSQLYTKSYDDFQKQFSTPQSIDKLYQNLNSSQLYTKTKDNFYDQFFASNKTAPVPEHQIVHSDQQNNDFLVGQAQDRLQQHITGNAKEAAQEIYANEFAQATKDLANGKITVDQFKTARDNYVNNRVNVEQGNDKMVNQSQSDPYAQGIILKHVVRNNPQAGNQIKQDVALVSARDRLATHGDQIRQNLEGIKKGDLDVDLSSGQVIKPVGLWQSTVNSLRDNLNAHSEFLWNKNHTDQEIADKYLGESDYINPDKPLEVPKGVGGKIGEFLGGNLPITTGGFALGAVEKLLPEANWAKVAALGTNSAMVGTDMYMVGHANSMKQHFWENIQNGMKPEDAVKDARVKANYDASVDATSGVIMGAIASMGDVGEVKLSPETRGFARGLYNEGKNLLKYATPEAAATGLISVASQEAKNAQNGAQNNDGLSDAALAGVLLPFAFRFGGVGTKLIKGELWNNIKSDISKMPEGIVNANIDNAVQSGQMNPSDAADFKNELTGMRKNDSKIPVHVTDPEVRQQASDLIDKFDEEKNKLDVAHEMNKGTIKARMNEIEDRYNKLIDTTPQENIRTKKIDFDKVAIAKQKLNDAIEQGDGEWTDRDLEVNAAKNNPEGFLKQMAMQTHGIDENGNPLEGGGKAAEAEMKKGGYSDELINSAKDAYPIESFKNTANEETNEAQTKGQVKTSEGAAENKSTLPSEDAASSSIPQHEKIQTDKNLRTLDYGDFKGQKEDAASNEQIRQDILNDVPVGKSGEKFSDFLKRSIPAIRNIIEDKDNNSVIVTHSSVIKALKVWEQMGRPENIEGQKLKDFAQAYVDMKPKREGDVQVLKGGNGTATQVVRHGETEDNKISDFREDNTELTDRGIEQAKKAGKSVNEVVNGNVAKVVASDLPRTVHTANLIMDEVEGKNNSQTKNQNDALQEPSTSSVLQHPQEAVGETGGGRGRVEQQQQGNEPPEKTIIGQQPPPVEKGGEGKGEEEPNEVGISHDALNQLSKRLGLPEMQRGEVMEPRQYAMMGRIMLKDGVNPNEVLNSNIEPHEKASIARAYLEELVKKSDELQENGTQSEQNKIKDEISAFQNNVVKKLGTQWAELGRALQGRTDIDTGSFTSVRSAVMKATGQAELSAEQKTRVAELTSKNKELQKRVSDVEAKLVAATDKELNIKEKSKPSRERLSTQLNDLAKRLRTSSEFDNFLKGASGDVAKMGIDLPRLKEIAASILEDAAKAVKAGENAIDFIREAVSKLKEDVDKDRLTDAIHAIGEKAGLFDIKETPEQKNIARLEKQLSDLQEGTVKQSGIKREPSAREKELQDQIFEEKQRLGLTKGNATKGKKSISEPDLAENTATQIEKGNRKQLSDAKDLAAHFVNHSGDKFTPKESSDIWAYMKEHYRDKGVNYRDAIINTSDDLGLTFRQISKAIVSPKTEAISNEMWKRQYDLEKNRQATQRYVDTQGRNQAIRAFKTVANAFREEVVFGHGGVFVGTHAGMTLMDLPRAKYTLKAFFKAYKFAYGNSGDYQKAMTELKSSPNYALAQRAGLRNNPDIINNDAEIIQPIFGKFSESGKRGFNAIKVLRQDLFDSHYNALSGVEKKDPNAAVSVAKLVNNATGATNLKLPNWVNEVTFAGGMEAARWGKLTSNPLNATKTAIKALLKPESATTEEKVFAKVWAKRVGTELGTFAGLLTLNAAIQSMITDDKKKQVNLFDPTQSDWLKPKIGSMTFDFTSGMLSTTHFAEQMLQHTIFDNAKNKRESEEEAVGKTLVKYGQGKLSPFYGDVAETLFKHDYSGNTLPWSNAKPEHKYNHKMTWPEYMESKLPLPAAEGFRAFYESANKSGMSQSKMDDYLNGILYGIISGGTGFRAYETNEDDKKPSGSGAGAGSQYNYSKPILNN